MTRDGDPSGVVMAEYIIQNRPTPDILVRRHLPEQRLPQKILLRESVLDDVRREAVMDVCLVASTITSMSRNTFTEQFLNSWDERPGPWERKSGERDVRSLQATGKRRSIVSLGQRDLLQLYAGCPESIRFLGLQDTVGVNVSVGPDNCSVAVFLGPVALQNVSGLARGLRLGNLRSRQEFRNRSQRRCDNPLHGDP